jgi:hypothetical protein
MRQNHIWIWTVLLQALLCLPAFSQRVQSMKLLTPRTGWAQAGKHLYWTTDGGEHWQDVAPPESSKEILGSVFFLDTSTGWMLLSYPNEENEPQFRMASTRDAGATWSSFPVRIPWKRYAEDFFGGGSIFFLDQLHGWLNLDVYGMLQAARLFSSQDGGRTWQPTPDDPGRSGSLCFFNNTDGVLAGGAASGELYVTHDGSSSWQESTLKAPPDAAPAEFPTFGAPICQDAKHGVLPVTYSVPGSPSALVMFTIADGGRTWKPNRVEPGLEERSVGQQVAATVSDSDLILAPRATGDRTLELMRIPERGEPRHVSAKLPDSDVILELSFVSSLTGWARTWNGLLSTSDGGASWNDITPRE